MNGYRLSEVSERSGVVREDYTQGEGWDANGSPVMLIEPKPRPKLKPAQLVALVAMIAAPVIGESLAPPYTDKFVREFDL